MTSEAPLRSVSNHSRTRLRSPLQPAQVECVAQRVADRLQSVERPGDEHLLAKRRELLEQIVAIDREAPAQPRVGAAVRRVGDEARRRISPRTQKLGHSRRGGIERRTPTHRQLVGPSPCEHTRVRGRVHDEVGCAASNRHAAPGQFVDRRAGRARVAIKIEVIGGDGVHHDQEDARSIGRDRPPQLATLLDPVGRPRRGREGQKRQRENRRAVEGEATEGRMALLEYGYESGGQSQGDHEPGHSIDLGDSHEQHGQHG